MSRAHLRLNEGLLYADTRVQDMERHRASITASPQFESATLSAQAARPMTEILDILPTLLVCPIGLTAQYPATVAHGVHQWDRADRV